MFPIPQVSPTDHETEDSFRDEVAITILNHNSFQPVVNDNRPISTEGLSKDQNNQPIASSISVPDCSQTSTSFTKPTGLTRGDSAALTVSSNDDECSSQVQLVRKPKKLHRKTILVSRCLSLFLMIMNAHSQVLFVALDPATSYPTLVIASLVFIFGFAFITVLTLLIFGRHLTQQFNGQRRALFYWFLLFSLLPDVAGLVLTVELSKLLQYDQYALISNLLPPVLSMLNTLVNVHA